MGHTTKAERRESAQKRQLQNYVKRYPHERANSLTVIVAIAVKKYGLDEQYPLLDWAEAA